jgi:tetratricopeptide (TPR) repeat protein
VKVSVNSTKCTTSAGGKYLEKAQVTSDPALKQKYFDESFNYLTKAVSIYPANTNGRLLLGNALAIARQDYKGAIDEYMKVISIDPYNTNAYQNAIKVLGYMNRAENADYMLQVCYRLKAVNPAGGDIDYLIGKVYGQFKGNLDSSEVYLLPAVALSPGNPAAYKDLGVLYGMKQELDKALTMLKKANELDPGDVQTKQNLDMTYKLMGKIKK